MKGNVLARRYAGALIAISLKQGQLERSGSELSAAARVLGGREVWASFTSPLLPAEAKIHVIDEAARQSGWSKSVSDFLKLLVDKKRIRMLPAIAEAYADLADQAAGRIHATVESAVELDGDTRSRLGQKLAAASGAQVILDSKVNPSLVGGVKVTVGSRVIDGTIHGQLARLRDLLKKE